MAENSLDDLDFASILDSGEVIASPAVTKPGVATALAGEHQAETTEAGAETVTPPAAPVQKAPESVPFEGYLNERERRQAAERELKSLREQHAQPQKVPDVASDPHGWQAAMEARQAKAEMDTKMNLSGRYAAQTYGQDKVQAAMEWGRQQDQQDPFFGQKFMSHADPFGFLVAEHRRANALGTLGDKTPEDWALEYAASQGWKIGDATNGTQQPAAASVAAQPPARVAPPPRSIAGQAAAGGNAVAQISEKDLFPA